MIRFVDLQLGSWGLFREGGRVMVRGFIQIEKCGWVSLVSREEGQIVFFWQVQYVFQKAYVYNGDSLVGCSFGNRQDLGSWVRLVFLFVFQIFFGVGLKYFLDIFGQRERGRGSLVVRGLVLVLYLDQSWIFYLDVVCFQIGVFIFLGCVEG